MTPFPAVYGRGPPSRLDYTEGTKRRDAEFEPGQWVWLRRRAYRQQSIHHRQEHKLSKKYLGPFQIVKHIGSVAYELDLPTGSRISFLVEAASDQQAAEPNRNSEAPSHRVSYPRENSRFKNSKPFQ